MDLKSPSFLTLGMCVFYQVPKRLLDFALGEFKHEYIVIKKFTNFKSSKNFSKNTFSDFAFAWIHVEIHRRMHQKYHKKVHELLYAEISSATLFPNFSFSSYAKFTAEHPAPLIS